MVLKRFATVKLGGQVTIAFNKVKNLHVCNALEFDIVGTGDTADEALEEVKEMVEHYIETTVGALANGKKVRFFNPAVSEVWNSKRKRRFSIEFIIGLSRDEIDEPVVNDIDEMSEYSDSIESINLVPVPA